MKNRKRKYQNEDYKIENLPHNRYEATKDIIKHRYDLIIKIGIIMLFASLPFVIFNIVFIINVNSLIVNKNDGIINNDTFISSYNFINILYHALAALSIIFIFIGLSGILRIIKRLSFYESIQFKDDFIIGIKQNIKQMIKISIVVMIIYFISTLLININKITNDNSFINTIIYYLPSFLFVFLILPIIMISICQIPIYENKISQLIKNSLFFFAKKAFIYLLFIIIFILPLFLSLIRSVYVILFVYLIYIMLYFPLILICFYNYSLSLFDTYLNKEQFKEIYKKGIFDK